jgi:hypothetical protein
MTMRRTVPLAIAAAVLLVGCEPEAAQEERAPDEVVVDTVLHPDESASGARQGPGEFGPTGRHQQSEVVPEAGQRSEPGDPQPATPPDED